MGCEEEGSNPVESRPTYSIRSIYWTNLTDRDNDSYSSSGSINVEIDLGKNVSKEVHVYLYYKNSNELTWTYLQEKVKTIYGNNNDPVIFSAMTSSLYYGFYDFRIVIGAFEGSNLIYYADIHPENNLALSHQKFEYDGEDLRSEP